MRRLKCGDLEALAALFSQQRERLWRMVNFRMDRRLFGRVDPDDVLQDAYLAATGRLKHYGDDSSLSPFVWVRLILMQTLTDIHRHHLGRRCETPIGELALQARHNPQTTSVSMAAVLIGRLTSPSQAAVRGNVRQGRAGDCHDGSPGSGGIGPAALRGVKQQRSGRGVGHSAEGGQHPLRPGPEAS